MIVAKFIGRDGSCGFRYGETYYLKEPNTSKQEWKIMVMNANGAQWCSYNNVEAFLNNWEVKRCI